MKHMLNILVYGHSLATNLVIA